MFHFQNVGMSATDRTMKSELQVSAIINHLLVVCCLLVGLLGVFWGFFLGRGVVTLVYEYMCEKNSFFK